MISTFESCSMGGFLLLVPLLLAVLFQPNSAAPQDREETPRLVQGEITSIYNFPFVCSHHFNPATNEPRRALGTCTIMTSDKVFFATDTLVRITRDDTNWRLNVSQIVVIAGSDILDPPKEFLSWHPEMLLRAVKGIYMGKNGNCEPAPVNPAGKDIRGFARNNPLGESDCPVGIYLLEKPIGWGKVVLPIPLITLNFELMNSTTKEWADRLEYWPFLFDTCSIAGWGPVGNNEIMTHELTYVTMNECREVICAHHPSTCLEYPVTYRHVCFKSRQYGDVCVYDQGSPVFCPWFGKSIFAILTRTFDCGLQNMPAVYTLLSTATNFYRQAIKVSFMEARPNFTEPRYTIDD